MVRFLTKTAIHLGWGEQMWRNQVMRQAIQQSIACSLLVLSIYLVLNVFVEIPPYHDDGMTKAVVFIVAIILLFGAKAVHPKWTLWGFADETMRWVVVALLVILTLSVFLPALFCERAAKLLQRTIRSRIPREE
jgi:hypothetical protein